ncbi:MAG: inhibitor of cysteine peptidase [Patescibacteria group bacterium]|jgi:inhibitor of cysteine peptidase|nr:inhibitor of cysteine peptidase [Patescibacteria group bacterium]
MENNTQVKNFFYVILALVIVLVAFVLIRKNKRAGEESQYEVGQAMVDSIDITLKESFPVQVDVLVKGNLPDGCTELGDAKQQLLGKTFNINLETRKLKDADVMCTQALVPFEETIALENVVGITAGEYTVTVNGVSKTFVMDVDNYISNEDPLK